MVRIKGRDDLEGLKGRLTTDFRAVQISGLHTELVSAAPEADKKNTTQVLEHFYRAARELRSSENEFNKRARPTTPSLMNHLRAPEQLSALREFSSAKENLLGLNPKIGESIVRLVEKDISAATRPARPGV